MGWKSSSRIEDSSSLNNLIKPTQDAIVNSKSNMLKELLLNLEKKINKSMTNIDDKINTPVKALMDNASNAENLYSDKSNRSRTTNRDYIRTNIGNNCNNRNQSGVAIDLVGLDKLSQNLESKNSNENLKLLEISMNTDTQRLVSSPTQLPVSENNFSKERKEHKLLKNYQKQTRFILAEKKTINYSNVEPFSPIKYSPKNNPDSDFDNSYCSDKKFNNNSSFTQEFNLNNSQQLIPENQKENINKVINMAAKSENKLNIAPKIDFSKMNSIKGEVKPITPINMPNRNASFQDIFTSNQNSLQSAPTRTSQINSRIVALESFQSKVKDQILLVKTAIPKPLRRPSTSYVDKQTEKQIESRNECKPKFIKRDRSINQSIGNNSMTPNIQTQKNINFVNVNGVNLVETVNPEGMADRKIYEIRSLDAERENLKVFRRKLNALASLNLNEKKLTSNITQEIKNIVEEFKIRKYVISIKDQETLQTLNDFVLKGFNLDIIQNDKEPKIRCSSVNPKKQKQIAEQVKKIPATPSRGNENYNPAIIKKSLATNLMTKGGFSTLSTNYMQAQKNAKLTSNHPLKSNINILNNKIIDVNLFEITKAQPLPFSLYENSDFLAGNHANSAQGFM